jgi:hypothetical protein
VRSATEFPGTRPKHVCKGSRSSPADDLRLRRRKRERACQIGCADSVVRWVPRFLPRETTRGSLARSLAHEWGKNDDSRASAYLFPVRRVGTAEATADAGAWCGGFVGRDMSAFRKPSEREECWHPEHRSEAPFRPEALVDSRGGRRAILLNKATPATPPPRRCLLARGGCGTPIRVIHQRRRFRELSTRFIVFVSRTELSKMRLNERVGARRTLSRADAGRTAHSRAARRRRGRAVSLDILVRAPPIPV